VGLFEQIAAELPGLPEGTEGLAWGYGKLGHLHWCAGRADKATSTWRQALAAFEKRVADNHTVAAPARDLAMFLFDCPDPQVCDVPRAVRRAQQAVDRAPRDMFGWQVLGMAQFRAGQAPAAQKALHQAIDLGGGDPWSWFYLAMAHAEVGETDLARKWFERACAATAKTTIGKPALLRLRAEAAERLGRPLPAGQPDQGG
jgi:tetratricopeptide (TPR) repeat protein